MTVVPTPTPEPIEPSPWLATEVTLPSASPSEPSTRGAIVPAGVRGTVFEARWSPDGSLLAVATSEKLVAIVDGRTGAVRAVRRIRVRREASVRLMDLDATRLLISHGDYEDQSALVWDLVADTWQVVADVGEGLGLTPRGALVRSEEEGVVHVDVAGRRVALGHAEGAFAVGDRVLLEAAESTALLALPDEVSGEVRRIAQVSGAFVASRPRGGLFATAEGNLVRVARLADGVVVFERSFEGLRRASWDTQDRFVVDAEHEDTRSRHLFEGARGAPIDIVPAPPLVNGDVQLDDARLTVDEDGAVERRSLDGSSVVRWREPWTDEEREQGYDPDTGEEIRRSFFGLSRDQTRVLFNDTQQTQILDTADGRVIATLPRDDSGATSVWGVVSTPRGAVVWGRSHVSHWGPRGAHVFACRGSGFFFGDDDAPGWSNGNSTCLGERRMEWPMWDEENGQPAWVAGHVGSDLLVFSAGQIQRVDSRTLRIKQRTRPPSGFSVECYEEGCDLRAARFGNGAWLSGSQSGRIDPQTRFRPIDEPHVALLGGDRALLVFDDTFQVMDTNGRVLREGPMSPQIALAKNGELLVRGTDEGVLIVERADDGTEIVRLEAEISVLREVRESALVGSTEDETVVWHLPTGALRARYPNGTQLALDASGARLAVCTEGRLELHSVIEGRRLADLGSCELADSVSFVAGDRFVALPSRTQVTFFRIADGRRLVVHGAGDETFAEDGEQVFATPGAAGSLRWRAPGPIATAPLSAIDERLDATVISRFFGE